MQIRSRFKDYYDHIAHLYGGGDPSVVYVRDRLVEQKIVGGTRYSPDVQQPWLVDEHLASLDRRQYSIADSLKWLAVAGKAYLVAKEVFNFANPYESPINDRYEILDVAKHPKVCSKLFAKRFNSGEKTAADFLGIASASIVDLSKKLNVPVFYFTVRNMYSGSAVAMVESEIPILSKIGFPSILSAEQCYQEIAYFMGNTIKDSPDMMPIIPMANKDKILSHGFDVKQSFRHRVNA